MFFISDITYLSIFLFFFSLTSLPKGASILHFICLLIKKEGRDQEHARKLRDGPPSPVKSGYSGRIIYVFWPILSACFSYQSQIVYML